MKALGRWLFGDVVSVVAPRVERATASARTERIARVEEPTGICPHCGGPSEYQNVRYPRAGRCTAPKPENYGDGGN
jgi:hypothetical protein